MTKVALLADVIMTRTCRTCGKLKPAAEFSVTYIGVAGNPSYHLDCRNCINRKRIPNPTVWAIPNEKACVRCLVIKPIADFPIRKIRKDGQLAPHSKCRPCFAAAQKPRSDAATERKRAARPPKPIIRVCVTCGVEKPLKEFQRIARQANGEKWRLRVCIPCHAADIAGRSAVRDAVRAASIRRCKECGETKPLDEFVKKHQKYIGYKCKACHNVVQRVYGRKWTATNPTGQRAKERRRRAARRGAEGTHTPDDIARIRKAQRDRCCMPWCRVKLKGKGHVEHRVPLWAGGSDDAKNLQLACGPCNSSKGKRDEIDFVQSRNTPATLGQLLLL
jgi:5-methylcytosine-specific restriction endonuclease McrA